MKFYRKFLALSIMVLMFLSCEKEIDLTILSSDGLVVVEGVIETNEFPYVTLTNSIGFFSKIDLSKVQYIKNAQVKVLDITDNKQIQLKEYTLDTFINGNTFSFTVYAPDFADPNAAGFVGQVNHSYKLSIDVSGKMFESITTIPPPLPLDSIWTEPVIGKEDSFSVFKAMFDDPDTLGNSVYIETKLNKFKKTGEAEVFYKSDNYVYDDEVINGLRFPVTIDMGYDKSQDLSGRDFENIYYMHKGDTVTVKWSAIDRKVYRFWETLIFSKGSVGNPFASPTKVQGNIPGALGVWAGYSPSYYTIIDSL